MFTVITKQFFSFISIVAIGYSLVFFSNNNLCARPNNIREMSGWYNGIIDDKKYLSPFIGFIWIENQLTEKYYHFGDKDSGITRLTYELFHSFDTSFNSTELKYKPATHCSAETIGKILNVIETTPHDKNILHSKLQEIVHNAIDHSVIKKCDFYSSSIYKNLLYDELEELRSLLYQVVLPICKKQGSKLDLLLPLFGYKMGNLQLLHHIKKTPKKLMLKLKDVKKLRVIIEDGDRININGALKKLRHFYKKINDNNNAECIDLSYYAFGTSIKTAHSNVNEFITAIIDSLKESGWFSPLAHKVPHHTTHSILLSFLYQIASSKEDFHAYCNQFETAITKITIDDFLSVKFDEKISHMDLARQITNVDSGNFNQMINELFEQIAFTAIEEQIYKSPIPMFSTNWQRVAIKTGFNDCVEMALLNWFRLIMAHLGLYDRQNKRFDSKNIASSVCMLLQSKGIPFCPKTIQTATQPISKFFKKFHNPSRINDPDLRLKWATMISNLPEIKYLQRINNNNIHEDRVTKNNAVPYIHTNLETKNFQTPVEVCDNSWYLYEIAGYPSNLVTLCNHFFGFNCKDFSEFCALLNITKNKVCFIKSLKKINDTNAYKSVQDDSNRIVKVLTWTTHNGKDIRLRTIFSAGHSSLLNMTTGINSSKRKTIEALPKMLIENFNDSDRIMHLLSLYSDYDIISASNENLPEHHRLHRYLQNNLFCSQTRTRALDTFSK